MNAMKEVKSVYQPGLVSFICRLLIFVGDLNFQKPNLERIDEFEGSHQSELYSVRRRPTGNEKFNYRFYSQKPYQGRTEPKRYHSTGYHSSDNHCSGPPGGGDHSPNYVQAGPGDNNQSNNPASPGHIQQERERRISWSVDRDRMFSLGFKIRVDHLSLQKPLGILKKLQLSLIEFKFNTEPRSTTGPPRRSYKQGFQVFLFKLLMR